MRKFACFSFAFSAAVLLSEYILSSGMQTVFAAVFFVIGIIMIFLRVENRKIISIAAFGLSVGFLWCIMYSTVFLSAARELDGITTPVEAEVSDFPTEREYGVSLEVKIHGDSIINTKTVIYVYDDSADDLMPGDKVTFTADFGLSNNIGGDNTSYFFSKGVYLLGRNVKGLSVAEYHSFELKYLHKYLYKSIMEKILEMFPESTKGFALALLLGDKTLLSENTQTVTDMQRAGMYHIATVSGMHVSILVSFVYLLTGRKRYSAAILIPVLFLFMGILGFTPSVTRAVIMQIFIIAAPLFSREDDRITSLSAALFILLLFNPYSVMSAGLQLSFASTMGIILVSPKIYEFFTKIFKLDKKTREGNKKSNKWLKKLICGVNSSLSVSLGAMLFTIPLSAIYFGYVSLAAPVSNVLILWAATPAFIISLISVIFGFIFLPLGFISANVASVLIKYIIWMAGKLAEGYFSSIYVDNILLIAWLLYVYAAIILFALMKVKPRKLITPICMAVISLCIIMIVNSITVDGTEGYTMTVLDVGQGQSIVVYNSEFTAVIDCGSSSGEDAGDIAAEYIYGLGRDTVDLLILTHYHSDHANGVQKLMSIVNIRAFAVPVPENDDSTLDEKIIELASSAGSDIIYITEDTEVSLGDTGMYLYAPMGSKSENERGVCILIAEDEFEVLITGDIDSSLEKMLIGKEALPDIECLIVGHHGSKYSTCYDLLEAVTPEIAIISVGNNSYGHPTEEALNRLAEEDISVYRTDELGNVTVNSKYSVE